MRVPPEIRDQSQFVGQFGHALSDGSAGMPRAGIDPLYGRSAGSP
jgi:hypothetical protein